MLLNITNGDYLNDKLSAINKGEFFAFREAMIQGETAFTVLSDDFMTARAKSLKVSECDYLKNASALLKFVKNHKGYNKLKLWFGADTFCQLNLLTLLALLEQINYGGQIELNVIDDETGEIIQGEIPVELGVYQKAYKSALIDKILPNELGCIKKRAIELYFDYLSPNGYLSRLMKENGTLNEEELTVLLLLNSKEYGLSDFT